MALSDYQDLVERALVNEIARLQAALDEVRSNGAGTLTRRKPGRPAGIARKTAAAPTGARKRQMSPEARKRIGDATRARWAAKREASASAAEAVEHRLVTPEGKEVARYPKRGGRKKR